MSSRYFTNQFHDEDKADIDRKRIKYRILKCYDQIVKNVDASVRNGEKGLYTGTAGIAYALYYLIRSGMFSEHHNEFMQSAERYINVALDPHTLRSRKQVGFLSGNGGVYVVAALIYEMKNEHEKAQHYVEEYKKLADICEPIDFLRGGSDEVFVGRAGYLFGNVLLERELKSVILPSSRLLALCDVMMESGRKLKREVNLKEDLPLLYCYHSKPYLGSAHGMAGILQVLLSLPQYHRDNPTALVAVRKSVDFLLDRCLQNGNVATNLDGALSGDGKFLVHWCHGAAGIIYTFARAYLVFGKDRKYLDACKVLAETVWEKGLLKKGPGICHGIAGSGYVFLLMYRLTGEEKHLHRAERFASFMFTNAFLDEASTPDRPYSLFEGWAGTICFLTDLLQPNSAEYPLFNIFVE